jgi:hypothetical protein
MHNFVPTPHPTHRKRLFEAACDGEGVSQRSIVESNPVPLAMVNGGTDRVANLDCIDHVAYASLWERLQKDTRIPRRDQKREQL